MSEMYKFLVVLKCWWNKNQMSYKLLLDDKATSRWGTLPRHAGQVGQHVVELSVCDLSKRWELWEHNDGAAIISSTS